MSDFAAWNNRKQTVRISVSKHQHSDRQWVLPSRNVLEIGQRRNSAEQYRYRDVKAFDTIGHCWRSVLYESINAKRSQVAKFRNFAGQKNAVYRTQSVTAYPTVVHAPQITLYATTMNVNRPCQLIGNSRRKTVLMSQAFVISLLSTTNFRVG